MSTRIQWRGSNLAKVKEWLGPSFGYGEGQFYFDSGRIASRGREYLGFYGDWLVRKRGAVTVEIVGDGHIGGNPEPDATETEGDET